jgi:uncharacterized membrane protein YfcA
MQYLDLLLIGFISALLSSSTGAGAALFATPLLVSLGIPLPFILASNQFSAAMWTPIAVSNYIKGNKLNYNLVISVGLIGSIGVFIGYNFVKILPVYYLKNLIGLLIISVVFVVYFKKSIFTPGIAAKNTFTKMKVLGLPLGIYQSIFGSGNTLFSSIFFCNLCGFELKKSLAHSYSVAFIWCLLSSLLFFFDGFIKFEVVVPVSCGALLGAYLGSKYGSSLKTETLKKLFLFFGGVLGVKLLFLG